MEEKEEKFTACLDVDKVCSLWSFKLAHFFKNAFIFNNVQCLCQVPAGVPDRQEHAEVAVGYDAQRHEKNKAA